MRLTQLILLVIVDACAVIVGRAVSPLQETMQAALGLTDNQMALLQGPALALPTVFFAIPIGFLIDRYSRVRLCFVLTVLGALGTLMTAWVSNFTLLFIARALAGLSMTAITIAIFSLVADLYEPAQRGRAKAVVVIGQNVATSLTFALGGRLLLLFNTTDNWRHAIFWLTIPSIILVSGLMVALREPPRSGVVVEKPTSRQAFGELWRYRALIVPLIGGIVLAELPVYALLAWASPALSRHFSLTVDRVGNLMAVAMLISGILGPLLGGVLADFCQRTGGPRRTVIALSTLVFLGAPAGLFAIMPGLTGALILLTAYNAVIAAAVGMGITLFTVVIPNEVRGLCLAFLAAADSLFGFALAPLLVSTISGALGGSASIGTSLGVVCVAASVSCAAAYALATRSFKRRSVLPSAGGVSGNSTAASVAVRGLIK